MQKFQIYQSCRVAAGETMCAPTGNDGVYKQVSALNMKVSFTGTLETINLLLYTL